MSQPAKQQVDRRAFARQIGRLMLGAGLLTLTLSACAGVKSTPRDPNKKPFWERDDQRSR